MKITIDKRGIVEHADGSGVAIDIHCVGKVNFGSICFCDAPQNEVMPNVTSLWLDKTGKLVGIDHKGRQKMLVDVQHLDRLEKQAEKSRVQAEKNKKQKNDVVGQIVKQQNKITQHPEILMDLDDLPE